MAENLDDIFDAKPHEKAEQKAPADQKRRKMWQIKKDKEKEMAYAIADKARERVARSPEAFKAYLDAQANFTFHSPTNTLLVMAQCEGATRTGTKAYWESQGVKVSKAAFKNPILILEPYDYVRSDGKPGVDYNTKHVYDVSQTSMEKQQKVSLRPENDRDFIRAIASRTPCKIKAVGEGEIPAVMDEQRLPAMFAPQDGLIYVRRGLDVDTMARAIIIEQAHAVLAEYGEGEYDRGKAGFAAYCASYIVCKRYDVDVSRYSFTALPPEFSEMETADIRNRLEEINNTAKSLSGRIYNNLKDISAEKEQARTAGGRDER